MEVTDALVRSFSNRKSHLLLASHVTALATWAYEQLCGMLSSRREEMRGKEVTKAAQLPRCRSPTSPLSSWWLSTKATVSRHRAACVG